MKKEEIFERVVENAFDFFDKSLKEFEGKHYKYSIIHFCAAVELFLKARLLCEHWTLVMSRQKEPDLDEFLSGDARSATIEEIKLRLRLVAKDGLSAQTSVIFGSLAKHRNRIIHLCHPDLLKEDIPRIVGEQCQAWHCLQALLTVQWRKYFKKYKGQIECIDRRMKKHREYLGEKFKLVRKQIKSEVAKGNEYLDCPTCNFKALKLSAETTNLFEAQCAVCDFRCRAIRIDCPSCGKAVTFINEGFAECACGKKLDFEDLFKVMFDSREADVHFMEGDYDYRPGNCCECDAPGSVIPYYGEYFCLNCFGVFQSLYTCDWCNESQTDSLEDSYLYGCQFCDGKWGDVKDD